MSPIELAPCVRIAKESSATVDWLIGRLVRSELLESQGTGEAFAAGSLLSGIAS